MSEVQRAPKLQKWPFYLADLVLSAIAAYVLWRLGVIQGNAEVAISIGCLCAAGWGAWLSITPWLVEYRTASTLAENTNLKSTLDQIQSLEKVAELIRQANAQWQSVQDASGRTVVAAREITEKMKVETDEFMKFIENAHDQERAGLRLEVEKLRKMEGDWIKVAVQMLDHTFALFRAAERSGQDNLILQLAQFQNACREVARRMGLMPYVPAVGDKFDPRGHQLPDAPAVIEDGATIGEVLATGFTYQGQLLRRSLVLLKTELEPEVPVSNVREEEPVGAMDNLEESSGVTEPVRTMQPEPEAPAAGREEPANVEDDSKVTKRSRVVKKLSPQNELPFA